MGVNKYLKIGPGVLDRKNANYEREAKHMS